MKMDNAPPPLKTRYPPPLWLLSTPSLRAYNIKANLDCRLGPSVATYYLVEIMILPWQLGFVFVFLSLFFAIFQTKTWLVKSTGIRTLKSLKYLYQNLFVSLLILATVDNCYISVLIVIISQ